MANPQIENGYIKISIELFEALIRSRIPGEARQCLDLIIRKTYGWKKKEDEISFKQFTLHTGIKRPNVIRSVKILEKLNLIGIKRDTNNANIYRINKDYSKWKIVSKVIHGGIKSDNLTVSKAIHTINTITKDNTLSEISRHNTDIRISTFNSKDISNIIDILYTKIESIRPNHRSGNPSTDKKIVEKMLRLDKRPYNEVVKLLKWYPIGEPYMPEIYSAKALREKYDKLQNAYIRKNWQKDESQDKAREFRKFE